MKAYEQRGLIRVNGDLICKKERPFGKTKKKWFWLFRTEGPPIYTETTSKPEFNTKSAAIKNAKRYGIEVNYDKK